jgi:CSLREA domain-containing protein
MGFGARPGFLCLAVLVASPLAAATHTVNSTGDEPDATLNGICATAGGTCTLRAAIVEAENGAGADTIAFNIPGPGPHTISPATQLPALPSDTTVDGYTQPGSQPNTLAEGGLDTVLQIVLTKPNDYCLAVLGDNVTIRGLVFQGSDYGIQAFDFFSPTTGLVITGNFFGTDPTGMTAVPNFRGIQFSGGGAFVYATVGGTNPADRNLISGNARAGISFGGFSSATIHGNVIGLNRTATAPLPNGRGIEDANALGNSSLAVIGGFGPGEANIIAGNTVAGVRLDNTGHEATIRGNIFYDNGMAIDLTNLGPTPNDPLDADSGANGLQNFPILTSVQTPAPLGTGGTRVQGVLHSAANTTYDLDFYENPACSNFPREFLEGPVYLGSGDVTTDGSGRGTFDITLPVTAGAGARIAATATNPDGHTSEFSQRIVFAMSPSSGPAAGGTLIDVTGTDFTDPTTLSLGGSPVNASFVDDHHLTFSAPTLAPGTVNDLVATTSDGLGGTLIKGWVSDFLDVPGGPSGHQFYSFVTTLVSNAITAGIGGGLYGVDQPTLRQQMAVFLLKGKHGLCYTPPPCNGDFADVPCPSTFANWIEALADQGISGGCGNGNFCPNNPVRRDQMAPFLLKAKHGSSYVPPACSGDFPDVTCPSLFADWIEQLASENITGGCGGGNYCPLTNSTRGQMATFVTKAFELQ